MVPVFALLLATGCNSEPTEDLRNGIDRIVAAPSQLFLEMGETKTVEVGALDEQGNPLTFAYEVTNEGAGIDVRRDSTFLPVYVDDTTLVVPAQSERFRFIVEGTGYTTTSFTVSAGGADVVIPVQVIPEATIEATISNTTPALGETVTITAPAGTRFTATSLVTIPDAEVQPFTVSVAADGSTIDAILPPNLTNFGLTITDVATDGAPTVLFAPAMSTTVTTTSVPIFTGVFSTLTPTANQEVTVTLTGATINRSLDPSLSDTLLILGSGQPTVTNVTSNSVSFIPAPGGAGQLVINGVVLDGLPQIALGLPAPESQIVTVGPLGPIGGTDDPSTAPSLVTPGLGFSSVLFDQPDFVATVDHFYKLVITEAGVYTVTMNWDIGSDLDMFLCPDPGAITGACDFQAAVSGHPEIGEYALAPGTYFVVSDDFGADAAGATLQINVDHAPPAAPVVAAAKAKSAAAVRKVRK